ncbi:SdpI family protein [Bacillus andreraoultii]|uniref:DUF1648 domain-containing protein n=1 Tax=Bacillus andreraoultii TaxID=1499685 RepID=UPI00053B2E74|nr:DUF1648 domain-containing protein [Bacillus andreraoultii]
MNSQRPKIKLPKTKSEWIFDSIGYTTYIASIVFLIGIWGRLPDKVPAHYNLAGEIDRWGSKWELLILPIIGGLTLIFMQILENYPEIHNYPSRLNEENAAQFYLISRKMLNQLKNVCLLTFSALLFESVLIALKWWERSGIWFLPVIVIAAMLPLIVGVIRQRKIK